MGTHREALDHEGQNKMLELHAVWQEVPCALSNKSWIFFAYLIETNPLSKEGGVRVFL